MHSNDAPDSSDQRTICGQATGPGGGGYVHLEITISGEQIILVSWASNGCPAAHKAANGLSTFLRGRTLEQASKIDSDDLLILIGGLPDGKGYYATIAVDALRDALRNLGSRQSASHHVLTEISTPDNYLT